MLDKKYIVRIGNDNYGTDFYGYRDIEWCISKDINSARIIDKLATAKSNATRMRNNLIKWAKESPHNDPRPYEPIEVVEVNLSVGAVAQVKPSVVNEI